MHHTVLLNQDMWARQAGSKEYKTKFMLIKLVGNLVDAANARTVSPDTLSHQKER